jgi:hypothetical protein
MKKRGAANQGSSNRPDANTEAQEERIMEALGTKAGTGTLSIIGGALLAAAIVVGTFGSAQASDSADRFAPPSATEIAMLRNLLALQHPSLKNSAPAAPVSTTPAMLPAVGREPLPHDAAAPATLEGEVDASPAASRISRLDMGFRASLDRAMAAAGYSDAKF